MQKILVSGFEAFAGNEVNPTQDLVHSLVQSSHLQAVVLPVSFEKAWKSLESRIAEFRPDWVISFGVAARRETIDFERVALNFMDASIADNDGLLINELSIESSLPACVINELPFNQWKEALSDEFPVNISLSAGSFVCNHLYFHLLNSRQKYGYQAVFIHIPYASHHLGQESFQKFLTKFLQILNQSC